jgi:hypothetical protein
VGWRDSGRGSACFYMKEERDGMALGIGRVTDIRNHEEQRTKATQVIAFFQFAHIISNLLLTFDSYNTPSAHYSTL